MRWLSRKTSIYFLIGLTSALPTIAIATEAILVGSISDSRADGGYAFDGTELSSARAQLTNSFNFGANSNKIGRPIKISNQTSFLTFDLLQPIDIFFVGYIDNFEVRTPEPTALRQYVEAGGVAIITCDDSSHDSMCAFFGYPANNDQSNAAGPILPTVLGNTHSIFSGPFGQATILINRGNVNWFTPQVGDVVLAESSDTPPRAIVLEKKVGAGRIILLGDVDMISNATVSPMRINNDSDRFLLNLFAYAATAGDRLFRDNFEIVPFP